MFIYVYIISSQYAIDNECKYIIVFYKINIDFIYTKWPTNRQRRTKRT